MRIYQRTTLVFSLTLLAILLTVFFYLNEHFKKEYDSELEDSLKKDAKLASLILEKGLNAKYTDDEIADQIGQALGFRVTIIESNGKVVGDSEIEAFELKGIENHLTRPEVKEALNKGEGESRRFSTTLKKQIFYYALRVNNKDGHVRVVRFAVPTAQINVVFKNIQVFLVGALLPAFILAVLLTYLFVLIVSRPMKNLLEHTNKISEGTASYSRFPVSDKGEVGRLSEAFNGLLDKIEEKMSEVVEANSRLQAVIFSMFDGVMVIDTNGDIKMINKKCKELFGVMKEDVAGKRPIEITRAVPLQAIYEKALSGGETISEEVSIIFPKEKTLLVHATPVIKDRSIIGAVVVFNDITETRKLELIRRDFVANVSHELRTPISNIKGYSETLIDGAINDKDHALDFISVINKEAVRLAELINDLLDLARIESGTFGLEREAVSPKELVDNVVSSLEKISLSKEIRIINDIGLDIENMSVDKNLITQVFFNLIHNAVKYTPKSSGDVRVSVMRVPGGLKFTVTDNGIGIPERDIERIFERFYMVDKARSRDLGGTGLGLAIVKHIVQLHGGEVFAKSTEGKGSEFSFTIPSA